MNIFYCKDQDFPTDVLWPNMTDTVQIQWIFQYDVMIFNSSLLTYKLLPLMNWLWNDLPLPAIISSTLESLSRWSDLVFCWYDTLLCLKSEGDSTMDWVRSMPPTSKLLSLEMTLPGVLVPISLIIRGAFSKMMDSNGR